MLAGFLLILTLIGGTMNTVKETVYETIKIDQYKNMIYDYILEKTND